MSNSPHCSVALLRPPETSLFAPGAERWQHPFKAESPDAGEEAYCPFLDAWIGTFRRHIATIAEEEGVPTSIDEYQWNDNPGIRTPWRRSIPNKNVLTFVDPTHTAMGFLAGFLRQSPHGCGLVAFSSEDYFYESCTRMAAMHVPCFAPIAETTRTRLITSLEQECTLGMLPRCFAFPRDNEEHMQTAVRNALRYPHGVHILPMSQDTSAPNGDSHA